MTVSQTDTIVESMGRSLSSQFWGYYVAAIHYPTRFCTVVSRSPVSPLACFHMRRGSISVFFSYVEDGLAANLKPISINWDSITAQVVGGDYLTSETGINEIEALECGESVECAPHEATTRTSWDPRKFLQNKPQMSFGEAVGAVRAATEGSVDSLSSAHGNILMSLSGGLDSSIVLSSLSCSTHKPHISAVTYFSRGPGDERRFARIMAESAGCNLVECERNTRLDLRRFHDIRKTARPVLNFSAPDVEARNIALARELNASAIFNGELGDNVFGSHPHPGTLLEAFLAYGVGRRFLSIATDYSMITRQSIWRALRLARQEATSLRRNPDFLSAREMERLYGVDTARSFILASSDAEERARYFGDRFVHPWLKETRRLAPGAHALLFGLITMTSTSYHSPFSALHDPPQVSPLLSQPLVETTLQIPSFLHYTGGQDRAVARTAFADDIPPPILNRGIGKGGPGLWAKDVIDNNVDFIRAFLLEGLLVERRLVDRAKLEAVLSPRIIKSTVISGDIFAKLYIEAWLRSWQGVGCATTGSARANAGRL